MRWLAATLLVGLGACGGGGGDGGKSLVPFTTVSAIEPGQEVITADGIGRVAALEVDRDGVVTAIAGSFVDVDNPLRAGFDEATALVAVRIHTVDLDSQRDDVDRTVAAADPRFITLVRDAAPRNADRVTFADPAVAGLEHLLFGAWLEAFNDLGDLAFLGGGAYGTFTPADAVPTIGTASYVGASVGYQVLPDGTQRTLSANVTLTADFAAGQVDFGTDAARDIATGALEPDLALTGTLTLAGSSFSGTGTAANGWTGAVDGRFFGPAAEEAGGGFDLAGPGVERYVGGFGAAR
jgi:hypothetical protein